MDDPSGSGGWRFAQCFGDKGEVEDITEGIFLIHSRNYCITHMLTYPRVISRHHLNCRVWFNRKLPCNWRQRWSCSSLWTQRIGQHLLFLVSPSPFILNPSCLWLSFAYVAPFSFLFHSFALSSWSDRDNTTLQKKGCEYKFYTEFQSHEPEFDYLKSLEIEEKINKIRWCRRQNSAHFLLSTNGIASSFIPRPISCLSCAARQNDQTLESFWKVVASGIRIQPSRWPTPVATTHSPFPLKIATNGPAR